MVTNRSKATREEVIIYAAIWIQNHDRVYDNPYTLRLYPCVLVACGHLTLLLWNVATKVCVEVLCVGESACPPVSLNTFHYAAPDQRGGYQQKQGYQRGGYEHVKSFIHIFTSYSPVSHSFLLLPMNAVATLHLVVQRPASLFLAHCLVLSWQPQSSFSVLIWTGNATCMTSEVQYRRLFLFSVTAIDQKGGYQQKQNYQRGGYRNQNQSSYWSRCGLFKHGFIPEPDCRFLCLSSHQLQICCNTSALPSVLQCFSCR